MFESCLNESHLNESRLKLNLFRIRKDEQSEAIQLYYVLGRKPAGGMVARVIIEEDFDLHKNDTLVFDFTNQHE